MGKNLKLNLRLSRVDRCLLVGVPLTMVVVFFLLLGMLSAYQRETSTGATRIAHTLAANQRNQIDSFLNGRIQVLEALAQMPAVYGMDREQQRAFAAYWTEGTHFSHLFFVNNSGEAWYPLENGGTLRQQGAEQFFQDISSHEVFVTDPFLKDDGPIATVCVAIKRPDGQRVGTLCGAFYLSGVQSGVIDGNQTVYGGKCYLLDKEGRHIAISADSGWSYQALTDDAEADVSLLTQAYAAHSDTDGTVRVGHADQYASVALSNRAPWAVIVCVPYAEVAKSTLWMERALAVLAVLSLLMIFALAHILKSWRRSDDILYRDSLCPCGSRTALQQMLLRLEERYDISITILYADLNWFKYVNDTFGHEQGDRLLVIFAHILSRVFDGTLGYTMRAGGDEFVVVMTDVSPANIPEAWEQVEDDLRDESRRLPFHYRITASYGCATRPAGDQRPLSDVVREADHAMYVYKERFKRAAGAVRKRGAVNL